jgi:mannosyltransferase OCH1-like enzyme
MKKITTEIWKGIKSDIKTENRDFQTTVIKCLVLAVLIILGLAFPFFVWIAFALALIFAITCFNVRSIYIVVFLYPLFNVFRIIPGNWLMISYVIFAVVVMLGIKYLIQLFKKQKKIDWASLVLGAILIIMVFFPFAITTFADFTRIISMVVAIAVLYLIYAFRKELSFKELALIFFLGVLASFTFGFLDGAIDNLSNIVWRADGRYSGLNSDPNFFAIEAIISLILLCVLFFNRSFKYLFSPAIVILSTCVLRSVSKAGVLIYVVFMAIFVGFYLAKCIKEKNLKKFGWFALIMVGTVLIIVLINLQSIGNMLDRLSINIHRGSNQGDGTPSTHEPPPPSMDGNEIMNNFTTGRWDIWISYLVAIFGSIQRALFGFGFLASPIGEWANEGLVAMVPHNTFIDVLYFFGIAGLSIMLTWVIVLFVRTYKNKQVNWWNTFAIIGFVMCIMPLSLFELRLSFFIAIFGFALSYRGEVVTKEPEKKQNERYINSSGKQRIPKTIHYIWIGGKPKPEIMEKCITSWSKIMPDYEIRCWDESNLDISKYQFAEDAYAAGKFGFAIDPIRVDIINNHGGIFLDADVEALKPFDCFLHLSAFAGFEGDYVAPGLVLAAEKGAPFLNDLLEIYKNTKFDVNNLSSITSPQIFSKYLISKNNETPLNPDVIREVYGITLFPEEYFNPYNPYNKQTKGKLIKTKNTYSIHHYAATWFSKGMKIKALINKCIKATAKFFLGDAIYNWLFKIYKKRRGLSI